MKSLKRLNKIVQKQGATTEEKSINLKIKEAALLSLSGDADSETAHVNLKYYRHEHQCFSVWTPDELKAFSAFCRKITQTKWPDIYRSGGKSGSKTGLGYTVHKQQDVLPESPDLITLSPDLTWFELRVTVEARVHGFRCKNAFFLVYLDRQHEVYRA